MSEARSSSLLSASAVMAAGTGLSRILGFVRAILIAFVLGNGTHQVEAFTIANVVPNSLYILFAGGALNTVLVPQIVRATKNDADGGEAYTNRIMTAFLALVAGVTLIITLAAPWVLWIYSSSTWRTPEMAAQYESMVTLGYLCLPQIFFYGAFFLAGQVLNARGRFGPMMWAPMANNVVSIAVFGLYLAIWGHGGDGSGAFTTGQEILLGGGSTLGIVVQALILVPYLRAAGFRYRPRFDFRHTGLGHTFALAKWTLGFVAVNQLTLVVVNRLASSATAHGPGAGVNAYNQAYLLWILPHSLVTISLATAMLPAASRLAAEGNLTGVARETMRTLKLSTALVLPAAVAFVLLARPITRLVFGSGRGSADYFFVGWALVAFAIGLVPFTIQYICLRAFYALEDTRSTFFLQCVIAGVNALLAAAFVLPIGRPGLVAAGLALAYSFSYLVGVVLSFRWLHRKLPRLVGAELNRHLVRVTLAIAPGAVAAWLIVWAMGRLSPGRGMLALSLVVGAVVAVALYAVVARLLHLREVGEIVDTLRRRGRQDATTTEAGAPAEAERPAPTTVLDEGTQTFDPFEDDATVTALPPIATETGPTAAEASELEAGGPEAATVLAGRQSFAEDEGDQEDTQPRGLEAIAGLPEPVAVHAGQVLAGRYRLEEVVAGRANPYTWRAFDQVLSRAVLCHVLPAEDPRTPNILEAARRSAVATDSRFLRVLDAVHSRDPELGSYIVCEYAPGHNLETLLGQGPLSSLEAAWLTREVADALTAMHAQGLYHQRINPDTVVVTPAGNVKIVGFLLEAALLHDADAPAPEPRDPEAVDVHDLGRILYATLVSRWPGGPAYSLPKAPSDGGRLLTPRQVRAGVSPALDRITDQILGDPPRQAEPRLRTATEVVNALTKVLGTADAAHDLERRVRHPIPLAGHDPSPTSTVHLDRRSHQERVGALEHTGPPADATSPASPSGKPVGVPPAAPADGGATSLRGSRPGRGSRRWLLALVTLLIVALLVGLLGVALRQGLGSAGGAPSTAAPASPTTAPGPVKIVTATEFDPEGDDGAENHDLVPRAYDGNPLTRWQTVQYRGNPRFGGLKQGVGLILDLGERHDVRQVKLRLSGTGTNVKIMVPSDENVTKPPMKSAKQWRSVGTGSGLGHRADVDVTPPAPTRFVMVYLTLLPKEGANYQGGVYEVEVIQ